MKIPSNSKMYASRYAHVWPIKFFVFRVPGRTFLEGDMVQGLKGLGASTSTWLVGQLDLNV